MQVSRETYAITDKEIDAVLDLVRTNGSNVSSACSERKINRTAFYAAVKRQKRQKDLEKARQEGWETAVDNVKTDLYKTALEGNVTAQIFFLKNKAKEEFGEEQNINVSVKSPKAKIEELKKIFE